jgi:ubiquinone/menaquinone biosynthesis C-methylase UbiE
MNIQAAMIASAIDFEAIKAKQQATWGAGDYALIGTTIQIVGDQLCETADLRSGSRVLDVAAGNGNATLAAARRFCHVTSTDYVESLLDRGRQRAEAEGLVVDFEVADAEQLPYDDGTFDVVLSTFGVMFTPDQARAAAEMCRVCRQGGRIAMSNWTPDGFIGRVFKVLGRHVPPPSGVLPPSRWGERPALEALFAGKAEIVEFVRRQYTFRYCSVDHFLDFFRTYYGPIQKAYLALEDSTALDRDLRALLEELNVAGDGTLVLPSDYVDVVLRVTGRT